MWSERWSEREKARSHTWHLNGFWPVCFLKWRVNSSERANLQWQPSQVQWYGFSPWNIKKEYSISKVLVLAVDLAYSAYSISCNFRCGFRMIWWPSVFTRNFLVLLMRFSKNYYFLKFIVSWTIFIWVQQGQTLAGNIILNICSKLSNSQYVTGLKGLRFQYPSL